jgi:S1-C subfamily serine protease
MTIQLRVPNRHTQIHTSPVRIAWPQRMVRPIALALLLTSVLFVAMRLTFPVTTPTPQPYLGVRYSPVTPLGVRVDGIRYGSPAAAAGLEPGDVIFAVNQRYLNDGNLSAALREFAPDEEVTFSVHRNNRSHQMGAVLGHQPTANAASELTLHASQVHLGGVSEANITFDTDKWVWHLHDAPQGSFLHNAGFRSGDTIVMIDQQKLHSRNHHQLMTMLLFHDVVVLTVERDGAMVDVPVPGKLASLLLFNMDSAPRTIPTPPRE